MTSRGAMGDASELWARRELGEGCFDALDGVAEGVEVADVGETEMAFAVGAKVGARE